MGRWFGMGTGAVILFLVGLPIPHDAPMPRDEVEAALDAEASRYEGVLREQVRGEVPLSGASRSEPFVIAPMSCARIVFGSTGAEPLGEVRIERHDAETAGLALMARWGWELGWGGALGWCTADDAVELDLVTTGAGGELLYRVLASPRTEGWKSFLSGRVGLGDELAQVEAARQRHEALAEDDAQAVDGSLVQDVPADRALALPASDATGFALRAVATIEWPDPAYDPRTVDRSGISAGAHPPVLFQDGERSRVLVALDAADLPDSVRTRCAAVALRRLSTPVEQVTRVDLGSGVGEPSSREAGLVDTVCPEDGLVVYAVAAHDAETWRVRVYDSPGGTLVTGLRGPTPVPDGVPVAPAHRRARSGCDAGVVDDCVTVAEHLATGQYAPRDLSEALVLAGRACDQAPVHCGKLGDYEAMAGRLENAVIRWRAGCSSGDGWACMQLGEALRLGEGAPFAPQQALDAYVRGWRSGIDYYVAYPRIEAMRELRLGR